VPYSLSYLQTLDSLVRIYHEQTLYQSLPYLECQRKSFITLMLEGLEHTYIELLWCSLLVILPTLDSTIRVCHEQSLYLSLPYLECGRKKFYSIDGRCFVDYPHGDPFSALPLVLLTNLRLHCKNIP